MQIGGEVVARIGLTLHYNYEMIVQSRDRDPLGPQYMVSKRIRFFKDNFTNFGIVLPWNIFVKILRNNCQLEMSSKRGSQRAFHRGDFIFTIDEPHGREKNLSKAARQHAIKRLQIFKLEKEYESSKIPKY